MVKLVLGPKGSGKTKWLIERANEEIKGGNGNIIFIDVDHNHIFSLDYSVRLINAMEFNIRNVESFYGFLCGIIGRDYDVEKIYVDGIYKIFAFGADEIKQLNDSLAFVTERFDIEFFIGSNLSIDNIPEELKDNCIELELKEGAK